MYWASFLHIYQPPTQKELWVRRITDESYRKIIHGLEANPRARMTLNINGILCELLDKYGGKDVLQGIKNLLKKGQIEITGSAKYHAFLPLIPESEIERQIKLNEATLDHYFGDLWRTPTRKGFFPPEMAYNKKIATVASRMGYQWIIVDELAFPGERKHPEHEKTYIIQGLNDFGVFFRERNLSFTILSSEGAGASPTILRYLGDRASGSGYALTAMDGETFGHHRPGLEVLLFDLLREQAIEPVTISELKEKIRAREIVEPRNSTWAATPQDIKQDTPYARWRRDGNEIQAMQWELTEIAIAVVERSNNERPRKKLDEALHSDQYWWASARPWWSLEMIERGAHELKNVILEAKDATAKEKSRAEELYKHILFTGFDWQRSGKVDEIARQEDEEVAERREMKEKLFITKAEYKQMIVTLEGQMHLAAKTEEYHRAAMIKDRIRELKEELEKAAE